MKPDMKLVGARPRRSGPVSRLKLAIATVGGVLLVLVPLAGAVAPIVSGVSPTSGPVGTPVTINGTDLLAAAVTFNGVAATIGTKDRKSVV